MKKDYGIKEVTLCRRDFRDYSVTESFFDDLLDTLGIPKEDQGEIGEITLQVDSASWELD